MQRSGVGVIGRFATTHRKAHQLCIDVLSQAARQAYVELGGENAGFTMAQQSNEGVGFAFRKRYDFPNRKAMHALMYVLGPACAEKAGGHSVILYGMRVADPTKTDIS